MEHFLFLRHVLNRCSFRDNCVWICYKLFVVIYKLFWIFNRFLHQFLNFHKMNIIAIFIDKWYEQNDAKIIQFEHCFGLLKRKHESEHWPSKKAGFSTSHVRISFVNDQMLSDYLIPFRPPNKIMQVFLLAQWWILTKAKRFL